MPPAVAALNIGVGPCWEEACGDLLEAMARIAHLQPNDAMVRIASRRNNTISLDPNLPGQNSLREVEIPERGSIDADSKVFSKIQIDSISGLGEMAVRCHHSVTTTTSHRNPQFYVQRSGGFADPPL